MSETCPHCRRFREERDEALERLRQVRPSAPPAEVLRLQRALEITPQQAWLLLSLQCAEGEGLAWEVLALRAFPNFEVIANPRNQVNRQILSVRRRLPPGATIETVWGFGYRLSPASKAALRAFLDEKAPA